MLKCQYLLGQTELEIDLFPQSGKHDLGRQKGTWELFNFKNENNGAQKLAGFPWWEPFYLLEVHQLPFIA